MELGTYMHICNAITIVKKNSMNIKDTANTSGHKTSEYAYDRKCHNRRTKTHALRNADKQRPEHYTCICKAVTSHYQARKGI